MNVVVTLDNCVCPNDLDALIDLHEAVPELRCTVYVSPNRLGPVHDLTKKFPWIQFGIHGWEGTKGECLEWTIDKALALISKAFAMGYSPVFKPPNWTFDAEVLQACATAGAAIHLHTSDAEALEEPPAGLQVYHGSRSPRHISLYGHLFSTGTDRPITSHPGFIKANLAETAVGNKFVFVTEFLGGTDAGAV